MPAGVRPDNPLRATHAVAAVVAEVAIAVSDGDCPAMVTTGSVLLEGGELGARAAQGCGEVGK